MSESQTMQPGALSGSPAQARTPARDRLAGPVFWILLSALGYQALLCAIHTNLHPISMADVGLAEAAIYLACIVLLARRIPLELLAVGSLTAAYLLLWAILRNQLDPKGFRDVLIPILFYGLGRQLGSVACGDRLLKWMIALVLAFGFFELFLLDWFSRIFNIFSYYVSQGGLVAGSNWAKGSVLGLNGIRPEGIGRTILPSLLGNHRVSSLFLEPVSLGNFAVIVAAWGLAKNRDQIREAIFFLLAAAVMITLSDSRYGMITVALLILLRCLPLGRQHAWLILLPPLCVLLLLVLAGYFGMQYGDNIIGRLYVSGRTLLGLDLPMIFGLDGFNTNYGDMGYPSLLTRLGLLLCLLLWAAFWMIRMPDQRGVRLRASLTVYISLILCVSGTSLFALKTAGILWFLVGCMAHRQSDEKEIQHAH